MSFEALLWATNDAPIADVNEFAVLAMLAEEADSDGCNAFPSRTTMANRTHIDPKTVLRTLQRLESRGLISKGDQGAAAYLRADRRPVVYDLLIPYSWFPSIERINKERRDRGRPPLNPQDRPSIAAPPEKTRRSDLGKERPRKDTNPRGDSEVPRTEVHGVTVSPERGDSESDTGGLRVTRTSPLILSPEPLSSRIPLQARPEPAAGVEKRETAPPEDDGKGLVQQLAQEHRVQPADIEAVLAAVRREGLIRSVRGWAGSDTGRADITDRLDQARRMQASRMPAGRLGNPEALDALSGVDDRPECACGALLRPNEESCGRCRDQQIEPQVGAGFQEFRAARERARHASR